MKRFLILLALTSAPLYAEETNVRDLCAAVGDTSEQIMIARQNGISLSNMMQIAESVDGKLRYLIEEITKEAYKRPRMNVASNRQREAEDFRNDMEIMCFEAVK